MELHSYHWGKTRAECRRIAKKLIGKEIRTPNKFNHCAPFICVGYRIKPLTKTINGGFELFLVKGETNEKQNKRKN